MFDADSGEVVEKTATKPLQSSTAQTTPKRWFILHGPAKRGRLVAQAAGGDILAEVRVAGVGPLGRTSSSPPDEDSPDPFGATN